MSLKFPDAEQLVYKVEDDLRSNLDPGMWTTALSADEQDLLIRKMGHSGWGRMLLFTKYYTPSWGEGNKQVSPRGQAVLLRFLEHVTFRDGAMPSIFLTDDGELELAWSDAEGKPIQLVFGPKGIEVYHEAEHREEVLTLDKYSQLATEFSHV